MAATREGLLPEPSAETCAAMIARTILFMMWFGDRERAMRFAASVKFHIFAFQALDNQMMGNSGGRA
jgi:hypothetical protein